MATSRIDGRAILAGITTLALIGSLFLVLRAPAALAETQHNNEYPSVYCGTGDTRETAWHWVHNQVPDGVTSATLTASFEVLTGPNTGSQITLQVAGDIGNNIHYDLFYPYGLKLLPTPSDDVTGGMLLLSHYPKCSDDTTTTTSTTSSTSTSTSTTQATTTSTTDPYDTTTSTTDPYDTTTSTTQATTTTSVGSSSTSTTDPYDTTTSTTQASTTSTTDVYDTTTSTTEATTTSTTEATTTSTTEATTTTSEPDEILDTVVTTTTEPDEVSPTVLPFTGLDSDSIFLIALILISTGVLTVVFMRGTKEWGES